MDEAAWLGAPVDGRPNPPKAPPSFGADVSGGFAELVAAAPQNGFVEGKAALDYPNNPPAGLLASVVVVVAGFAANGFVPAG